MKATVMARRRSKTQDAGQAAWTVQISQILRRYFVAGLATLFPIAVTLYLIFYIFLLVGGVLGRLLGFQNPWLGLLVTLAIILAVGVFAVHFFGRVVFQTVEALLSRLPVAKKVFPAVKQLTKFIFNEEGDQPAFRGVVLVEFPRPGSYSIAFVTNEYKTSVTGSSMTLLTLLIPTPPSPWSGPLIFVPKEEVIPLKLSVEDALKLVLSGGVVAPPLAAAEPGKGVG